MTRGPHFGLDVEQLDSMVEQLRQRGVHARTFAQPADGNANRAGDCAWRREH
jgi:hypothetical protein